ncbi:MAG: hypothetical protein R3332_13970 [Pseudohongiellaceae bacterium]|nr:hypothetical protein [Pseudohongiellaceae bacterium]
MSDEGEDLALFQSALDARFERMRLIRSSNEVRDRIQEIQKLVIREKVTKPTRTVNTVLGCRITNAMIEMKVSENEMMFLWDYISATAASMKAQGEWMEILSNKILSPKKQRNTRASSKHLEEQCKANLDSANETMKTSAIRLVLLEFFVQLETSKSGSSLTWFTHLFPQLKIKNPEYLNFFLEHLAPSIEEATTIIEANGLEYSLKKYVIDYLTE